MIKILIAFFFFFVLSSFCAFFERFLCGEAGNFEGELGWATTTIYKV